MLLFLETGSIDPVEGVQVTYLGSPMLDYLYRSLMLDVSFPDFIWQRLEWSSTFSLSWLLTKSRSKFGMPKSYCVYSDERYSVCSWKSLILLCIMIYNTNFEVNSRMFGLRFGDKCSDGLLTASSGMQCLRKRGNDETDRGDEPSRFLDMVAIVVPRGGRQVRVHRAS